MTLKEATKLKLGDTIYTNSTKESQTPQKIISIRINKEDKMAILELESGNRITHKDARFFPKPNKTEKHIDKYMTADEAKNLLPNDLIYIKTSNEFARIKREPHWLTTDTIEIELLDGSKVTNKEIQLAPENAKEGKAPF